MKKLKIIGTSSYPFIYKETLEPEKLRLTLIFEEMNIYTLYTISNGGDVYKSSFRSDSITGLLLTAFKDIVEL